jgi:hypothetical protein
MYDSHAAARLQALGLFVIVFLLIGLGIAVLYILTLRKALTQCAPHNRTTSPDSPWLLLIPLFNLVWGFILYPHISESLEREFRQRNLPIEPQPARTLGLTLAILHACGIVPFVNIVAGIAGLVCFILYWIKISGYANQLAAAPAVYYPQPPQPQWMPQPPAPAQPQWNPQPPPDASSATPQPSVAMPPARYCTACGASVRPNERFCANCGKPVA